MRIAALVTVVLAFFAPVFVTAQENTIDDFLQEVVQAQQELNDTFGFSEAPVRLQEAYQERGVQMSRGRLATWGTGLFAFWLSAEPLYTNTSLELRSWNTAVQQGRIPLQTALDILQPAMQAFRRLDQMMPLWLENEVQIYVERGVLVKRANAIGCCEPIFYTLNATADDVFLNSSRPDYQFIGTLNFVPPVPLPGEELLDVRQNAFSLIDMRAQAAIGNPGVMSALLRDTRLLLLIYPDAETNQLDVLLRVLQDRVNFQDQSLAEMLELAEAAPVGPLRDELLIQAQDALLDRAAHLAPLLASVANNENDAGDLTRLLDGSKRLLQFSGDLQNPLRPTTSTLRLISALKAASTILDATEKQTVQATEIASILSDIGTVVGPIVPVMAPFSAPVGAIVGLTNRVSAAWDGVSLALDGVSDAIKGDSSGIERAKNAANLVETALDPRAIIRDMAQGTLEGIAANIPFARSIIGWFSS